METSLKKNIYEELKCVWTGTAAKEFSVDCIIPDIMPDVGTVMDAEGVVLLRSKETETGIVSMSASVNVSVLYEPEDGSGLRALSAVIPVEFRLEAPGVDAECRTMGKVRIRALESRMVNSRKITVRADVEADMQSYQKQTASIPLDLEEGTAHILKREASCVQIVDVREKTFVITDDYSLPVGLRSVETILSQRLDIMSEDVKFVSGKAVFRGRVKVALLLKGPDTDQVFPARYETEFSQIMEVDGEGDIIPDVRLIFTGVYFDLPDREDESGRIIAELHMAAQCVCRKQTELVYIADLYSNRTAIIPERTPIEIIDSVRPISMRQTVSGRAEPFVGDCEVLSVSAMTGSVSKENDAVKVTTGIRLICRHPDGRHTLSRCRLGAEFTVDLPTGTELRDVTVTVADVFYTATNGGADVRVTLQMDALVFQPRKILCVFDIDEEREGVDSIEPMPSVTIVRVSRDADIWELAKKYHSTMEAISSVNEGKEEGLFLIPKSR